MNLTKAIKSVEEWNKTFRHIPEDDDAREDLWRNDREFRELAVDLVLEETSELIQASEARGGEPLPRKNDVEVLDAICDILVTTFGVAAKAGLTEIVEPAFKEVMRSNWSKADKDGNPIFYGNGKIAKSDLYERPDLEQFFDEEDLMD